MGGALLRVARLQGAGKTAFLTGLKVHPDLQPGILLLAVLRRSLGGAVCSLQRAVCQISDHLGNGKRVLRIRPLVKAATAQSGQGVADMRHQAEAGGFEQVFQSTIDRLAGHARPANLRNGQQQQRLC